MNPPPRVDKWIHHPDIDSGHITSDCVNPRNQKSKDYVCEISLIRVQGAHVPYMCLQSKHGKIKDMCKQEQSLIHQ